MGPSEAEHSSPTFVAMPTTDYTVAQNTFLNHLFALWYCTCRHDEKRLTAHFEGHIT